MRAVSLAASRAGTAARAASRPLGAWRRHADCPQRRHAACPRRPRPQRDGERGRADHATVVAVSGVVAVGLAVPLVLYAMAANSREIWGGLVVALGLMVVSAPLLYRIGQRQDRRVTQLIALALVAKLAAAAARYFVAFDVYGGVADASMYIDWGRALSEQLSQGVFAVDVGREQFVGTGFMRYLSGLAFVVIGGSGLGAFFFFSWLSFWGTYGFFRAFQVALPEADHVRYGALLFFLPSLLYWPSAIGKEAWMLLVLGVAAYGGAKVLTRRPGGYPPLLLGVVGAVTMRPHITALVCLALAAGYLRRTSRARAPLLGPLPQVLGLALIVAATFFVVDRTEEYFELDEDVDARTGAETILEETEERTRTGGSAFAAERVRSPLDLPQAAVTVVLRPFPWQAQNAQMLLSAIEGTLLLLLLLGSWRRVWAGLKGAWANPYLRFAAVFVLGFVVAYASVANFGVLARQRSQLYPLLLVFLAVPRAGLASPRSWAPREDAARDRPPVGS